MITHIIQYSLFAAVWSTTILSTTLVTALTLLGFIRDAGAASLRLLKADTSTHSSTKPRESSREARQVSEQKNALAVGRLGSVQHLFIAGWGTLR